MKTIFSQDHGSDEIWKVIKDIPYYSISNFGRIKVTNSKDKYASCHKDKDGYLITTLKGKTIKVHRLVAQYFVKNNNPELYDCINHIDEDKTNNIYTNLEWCDRKYNNNYGTKNDRCSKTTSYGEVYEYDLKGNIINVYNSLEYVAKNIKHGQGIKDAIKKNTFNRYFGGKYYFYYNEKFDANRIKQRLYIVVDMNNTVSILFVGSRKDIAKYFNISVSKFDNIKVVADRNNRNIIINNCIVKHL